MGRDLYQNTFLYWFLMFQSTRPHGARQFQRKNNNDRNHVSIHAPAWGATRTGGKICKNVPVSIHAPAWGATQNISFFAPWFWFQSTRPHGARHGTWRITVINATFQSTRPHGARRSNNANAVLQSLVSIHAPAWGATCVAQSIFNSGREVSIHAPAWGATKFSFLFRC